MYLFRAVVSKPPEALNVPRAESGPSFLIRRVVPRERRLVVLSQRGVGRSKKKSSCLPCLNVAVSPAFPQSIRADLQQLSRDNVVVCACRDSTIVPRTRMRAEGVTLSAGERIRN